MTRFKRNPVVDQELEAHPDYLKSLAAAAEAARAAADRFARQSGAPWMRRRGATSTVVIDTSPTGVRLVNTDHAGHLMEWGSQNNPPHAPLRRGVRAAGLHLTNE